MASYDKQTKQLIVLETNEWDVFLGRGKNTYFRPGNVYFRQLVDENVLEYERCGNGGSKTDIARKLISHIRSKGGRFVRQVPATNAQGQVVGALEIVGEDIVLAKAKQAMRDAAKSRREKKKATTAALPQHDYDNASGRSSESGSRYPPNDQQLLPLSIEAKLQLLQQQQQQSIGDSLALLSNQRMPIHAPLASFPPYQPLYPFTQSTPINSFSPMMPTQDLHSMIQQIQQQELARRHLQIENIAGNGTHPGLHYLDRTGRPTLNPLSMEQLVPVNSTNQTETSERRRHGRKRRASDYNPLPSRRQLARTAPLPSSFSQQFPLEEQAMLPMTFPQWLTSPEANPTERCNEQWQQHQIQGVDLGQIEVQDYPSVARLPETPFDNSSGSSGSKTVVVGHKGLPVGKTEESDTSEVSVPLIDQEEGDEDD